MRHLLLTNDYPPKVGGIQNYLWELYRRLPAAETVVLTRRHRGWEAFDAQQDHEVVRPPQPVLVPEPWLARRVAREVRARDIDLVMIDPAFPLGALAPTLPVPYGVVLHGAEVTFPGRLPATRQMLGSVLRNASLVVTAGEYSTAEAERAAGAPLPVVEVPPGVDVELYRPLPADAVTAARRAYGLTADQPVVLTLSRLVPRKGMDVLIRAAALITDRHPGLTVLVAGAGRDRGRLERLARQTGSPTRFLDRVPEADKPALYGAADVFAMLCRVRWGGLEQEGFGIVFLEAAACGIPQLAGRSGGSAEAVADPYTGRVVDRPDDVDAVAHVLDELLRDHHGRQAMGAAARRRAVEGFSYDRLAGRYHDALTAVVDGRPPPPAHHRR